MSDQDTKEYEQRVAMSHDDQIQRFGWCMCDDEGHRSEGCPAPSRTHRVIMDLTVPTDPREWNWDNFLNLDLDEEYEIVSITDPKAPKSDPQIDPQHYREDLRELSEQIQHDLVTYLDHSDQSIIDGVCQIVIDNFNKYPKAPKPEPQTSGDAASPENIGG